MLTDVVEARPRQKFYSSKQIKNEHVEFRFAKKNKSFKRLEAETTNSVNRFAHKFEFCKLKSRLQVKNFSGG